MNWTIDWTIALVGIFAVAPPLYLTPPPKAVSVQQISVPISLATNQEFIQWWANSHITNIVLGIVLEREIGTNILRWPTSQPTP